MRRVGYTLAVKVQSALHQGVMLFAQRLPHLSSWLSVFVVAIASVLIVRADVAYNQTYDEGVHIACGMEWLSLGTYNYETLHPPLARAATATLLYLSGIHSEGHHVMAVEGTALLNTRNKYRHNLLLARLGIVPFFWLSSLLIFRWMRQNFDDVPAALAVILFCFCPVVLAHDALATTDAPFMAMFSLSVIVFAHFLEVPSYRLGALAGLSLGLATLTKFTELPFFVVVAFVLLVQYRLSDRKLLPLGKPLALGGLAMCLLLWAVYHFSTGPLFTPQMIDPKVEAKLTQMPPWKQALLLEVKLPAPELFRGIYRAVLTGSKQRRNAFVLGEDYQGGRWYFFPVAILSKTPIALLLLACIGIAGRLEGKHIRAPTTAVLLGGIIGPMLIGVLGNINLGVRHVLPIYPFLAMLGALGVEKLRQTASSLSGLRRGLAALLVGWQIVVCLLAVPQFLPYFNEAAMPFFGKILVDSDLDWGQDLYRLESRLATTDPSQVYLAYFGDGAIVRHQSAAWNTLTPEQRPTGWVAISETIAQEHAREFGWLGQQPFERVGRSIRLYHFARAPA